MHQITLILAQKRTFGTTVRDRQFLLGSSIPPTPSPA
jgi:hypothetical protein